MQKQRGETHGANSFTKTIPGVQGLALVAVRGGGKLFRPVALFTVLIASLHLTHSLNGQLFVSSLNSDEVLVYQPGSGALIGEGDIVSAADAGLDRPHGILDRLSGMLVASFGSHEVKRYHRETGQFIDNFIPSTAGLNLPVYLAVGPNDGLLYASSQGNDRVLRFDNDTGVAADAQPFIDGGLLDAPSGFDWSPDGSVLYVAGRTSGNVLAYDSATGEPLAEGHEFATNLSGGNDTFGLKVDDATGDVFVATGGDVRRFNPGGQLLATISIPGLAIGLENSLDGDTLWVASNNTLYPVDKSNNSVGSAFLTGGTISTLNFFHFSEVVDPAAGGLEINHIPGGQIGLLYKISLIDPPSQIFLQWSENLENWSTVVEHQIEDGAISSQTTDETFFDAHLDQNFLSVIIGDEDRSATLSHPQRFYRLRQIP